MSQKRMTKLELAYYYVGQAVVSRIKYTEQDPALITEFRLFRDWLEIWLTAPQKQHVNEHVGIDFDNPERPFPRFSTDPEDDIPF